MTATSNPSETRNRRRVLIGVGASAAVAGVIGAWWRQSASGTASGSGSGSAAGASSSSPAVSSPQQLGEDFWALTLARPDDTPAPFSAWRGRPLLLNFWATWCPPCIREMPLLERAHREWSPAGLQIIGLAVDGPTPVRAFLQKTPITFPIVMAGADGSTMARNLGNTQGGLPYTLMVDARGHVLHRQMGELQDDLLRRWLEPLRPGAGRS